MRKMLFVMVLALAAPVAPLAAQNDEQAVVHVITRLFDGMRTRDTTLMRSLFAPDARMVGIDARDGTPKVRISVPDMWIGSIGKGTGPGPDEKIFDPIVHVDDNIAQAWVYYELWIGPRLNHCGFDAFFLVKLADGWKVSQVADTRRMECTPRG